MTFREDAVLALLRADLEDSGPGVTWRQVARAAGTRWPAGPVRSLRRAGFVIEETQTAFLKLWAEPLESSGARLPFEPPAGVAAGRSGGSMGSATGVAA